MHRGRSGCFMVRVQSPRLVTCSPPLAPDDPRRGGHRESRRDAWGRRTRLPEADRNLVAGLTSFHWAGCISTRRVGDPFGPGAVVRLCRTGLTWLKDSTAYQIAALPPVAVVTQQESWRHGARVAVTQPGCAGRRRCHSLEVRYLVAHRNDQRAAIKSVGALLPSVAGAYRMRAILATLTSAQSLTPVCMSLRYGASFPVVHCGGPKHDDAAIFARFVHGFRRSW